MPIKIRGPHSFLSLSPHDAVAVRGLARARGAARPAEPQRVGGHGGALDCVPSRGALDCVPSRGALRPRRDARQSDGHLCAARELLGGAVRIVRAQHARAARAPAHAAAVRRRAGARAAGRGAAAGDVRLRRRLRAVRRRRGLLDAAHGHERGVRGPRCVPGLGRARGAPDPDQRGGPRRRRGVAGQDTPRVTASCGTWRLKQRERAGDVAPWPWSAGSHWEKTAPMFTTRVAWLAFRFGWQMGVFDSVWHWTARLVARLLQFALCLAALILLSTGFVTGTFQGHSTMLGGRYVLVTAVLTFLGLVYAFWWFVFIELLRCSERPRAFYSAVMDLVLALSVLVAAIVLLLSDFVRNCLSFGHFVRCTNLNIAVILMFLATGSFLLTPWLGHRWARQQREHERVTQIDAETPRDTYHPAATPTTTTTATTHNERNQPDMRV